eukprot:gene11236-7806_t
MPSDTKALMADIQKVLREHNVDQARVSLDLFQADSPAQDIQIYVEQHPVPIDEAPDAKSPRKCLTSANSEASKLLTGMQGLKGAQRSPARGQSPEDHRTHMAGVRRTDGTKSPVTTTRPADRSPTKTNGSGVTAGGRGGRQVDYEDAEPRELASTRPGVDARELQDDDARPMRNLEGSGNLMAMLGLGGEKDQFSSEEERSERMRILKSWVASEPPKQFLNMKYAPPTRNLADGDRDPLPELSSLTPRPVSGSGQVPTVQSVQQRKLETHMPTAKGSPPPASPSGSAKSLKEMLAEQRAAEQRNKEGLKKHQQTMEEARRYINEVEADPERRDLVEFIKNPLTRRPTPPTDPRPRVTLPEEEKAKVEMVQQLSRTPAGREQLSSKDRYAGMLAQLEAQIQNGRDKEVAYQEMLEAAIKYNEKLGIKEGTREVKPKSTLQPDHRVRTQCRLWPTRKAPRILFSSVPDNLLRIRHFFLFLLLWFVRLLTRTASLTHHSFSLPSWGVFNEMSSGDYNAVLMEAKEHSSSSSSFNLTYFVPLSVEETSAIHSPPSAPHRINSVAKEHQQQQQQQPIRETNEFRVGLMRGGRGSVDLGTHTHAHNVYSSLPSFIFNENLQFTKHHTVQTMQKASDALSCSCSSVVKRTTSFTSSLFVLLLSVLRIYPLLRRIATHFSFIILIPYARDDNPPVHISMPSLKEMLAEQRKAEAQNKENLKKHDNTMAEARKYIQEVEADPERKDLVEFQKNPLHKTRNASDVSLLRRHTSSPTYEVELYLRPSIRPFFFLALSPLDKARKRKICNAVSLKTVQRRAIVYFSIFTRTATLLGSICRLSHHLCSYTASPTRTDVWRRLRHNDPRNVLWEDFSHSNSDALHNCPSRSPHLTAHMPSLQELLAEQQRAEEENRESLRRHERSMEECRRFIAQVEAHPSRRPCGDGEGQGAGVPSSRGKRTLAAGGHSTRTMAAERPGEGDSLPALGSSRSRIIVRKIILPSDEHARFEVLEQLDRSEAGKRHISYKDKYQLMQRRQENEIKRVQEKEARYKELVDAAVEHHSLKEYKALQY